MRILGIDLGSQSIKAVEVDSAFGRYEIHDYHEIARHPGQPVGEALAQLVAGLAKQPDKITVAMRTSQVTFRNLTLPTKDKKAIQAGVGFELEDELPFALEDSQFDYSTISQTKQATTVHVAATLKKHLAAFLAPWLSANVDPDLITTEAWAYRAVLNRVLGEAGQNPQAQPTLLIQIGHERTVLYLHWRGQPVLAREIPWGGRDITTAICQKYQIPIEQAESAKLDHGFVVPTAQRADATPEQLEFSDTLLEPISALFGVIKQTELSCKNTTQKPLGMIYLSGGTSLLPGLAKVLEEHAGTPVRPLQALSSVAASGVTYSEQTDGTYLLAASLALCLVGPDRTATINFRRGEFAKQGSSRGIDFKQLRKPLLAFGAVASCFFASLLVQSSVYQSRLEETDAQLDKSIRSFFGSISTSAVNGYLRDTSKLKASINQSITKQKEISRMVGPNPRSPTDFLKELSASVPKDVVVDLTHYQVGAAPASPYGLGSAPPETQASLTFLVSNPQVAEKLGGILGNKLTGLQKGKMEETKASDGTQRWKITYSGQPTEESYGK
jgi:type IV pilus assembly protein PilM